MSKIPKIKKKKSLKELSDSALLKLIKNNNSSEAFEEIMERHEKLIYDVCSKYSKKSQHIKYDEIIKEKHFIMWETIRTYKQGRKTKFSTWVGHFTRFYCLKRITYMTKNHLETGLESNDLDIIHLNNNKFDEIKFSDTKEYINNILSTIDDKRIKTIFNLRYFNGKLETWTSISEKMNISAMHIINLHNRGFEYLKGKIKDNIKY